MIHEKGVSYEISNTYSTLNEKTSKTKNVWMVFHGIGYLSRYFLRHFKNLDPAENYIIAPQAQSKYYLNKEYRHVGASWLTKENTEIEIENVLQYLAEVTKAEGIDGNSNLIVLGYSQGVSVATRWIARRRIEPARLIIHSGKIPAELEQQDFDHLKRTEVELLYGTSDPFLDKDTLQDERRYAGNLFGTKLKIHPFEGGHEVREELIAKFA